MRNPFLKTIVTYFELFILAFYLLAGYSNSKDNYGSCNEESNLSLHEWVVFSYSSFCRNNSQSNEEKTPRSNSEGLFIYNTLPARNIPDYIDLSDSQILTMIATPEYLLYTDQKSPPRIHIKQFNNNLCLPFFI